MHLVHLTLNCTACGTRSHHQWADFPKALRCATCGELIASFEVSEFNGFLYILSNRRMIDLFKVGYTERDPIMRADELSNATGVPDPYVVEAYFPSLLPSTDEASAHDALTDQRTNPQREFFEGPFCRVYEVCRDSTSYDALYLNPAIDADNIESYDPWRTQRPPRALVAQSGQQAHQRGNNFLCIECYQPMRPVKQRLQDRGVFRGCTACGFFVDSSGCEVSPRQA